MPITPSSTQGTCLCESCDNSSVSRWNGDRYSGQALPNIIMANRNNSQGNRHADSFCVQPGGAPVFFRPNAVQTETLTLCNNANRPPSGQSQPQKKRPNSIVNTSNTNGKPIQTAGVPARNCASNSQGSSREYQSRISVYGGNG